MNFRNVATIFSIIACIFLAISGGILATEYLNADTSSIQDPDATPTPIDTTPPTSGENGPFNILLIGSQEKKGYTDIIMALNYNPEDNKVYLLSIPANIQADVPVVDGVRKLGYAYKTEGAEYTVDLITHMFGINFKYYICFDSSAIKTLVDKVNGVEFDLPVDLKSTSELSGVDVNLSKGKQIFDGNAAVQFISFKKPIDNRFTPDLLSYYDGSIFSKITMNQSFFIELILQKANKEVLENADSIFSSIKGNIETNITEEDINKLVENAKKVNVQRVFSYYVNGTDENIGNYYFIPNNRVRETNTVHEYKISDIINNYFKSPAFISTK